MSFGDIQIKLRSEAEASQAYKRFDMALRTVENFIEQLDQFTRFKRHEASKEELVFAQRLLTQLKTIRDYLKTAKEMFGAMLGAERIKGRRGRPGKAVLGIYEFTSLVRTLTLVERIEQLEQMRSKIILAYEPGEKSPIVRTAEDRLKAIVDNTKAALKTAKGIVEEILEQIKERCDCKITP